MRKYSEKKLLHQWLKIAALFFVFFLLGSCKSNQEKKNQILRADTEVSEILKDYNCLFAKDSIVYNEDGKIFIDSGLVNNYVNCASFKSISNLFKKRLILQLEVHNDALIFYIDSESGPLSSIGYFLAYSKAPNVQTRIQKAEINVTSIDSLGGGWFAFETFSTE